MCCCILTFNDVLVIKLQIELTQLQHDEHDEQCLRARARARAYTRVYTIVCIKDFSMQDRNVIRLSAIEKFPIGYQTSSRNTIISCKIPLFHHKNQAIFRNAYGCFSSLTVTRDIIAPLSWVIRYLPFCELCTYTRRYVIPCIKRSMSK